MPWAYRERPVDWAHIAPSEIGGHDDSDPVIYFRSRASLALSIPSSILSPAFSISSSTLSFTSPSFSLASPALRSALPLASRSLCPVRIPAASLTLPFS
jgi:hypothetical protein